MFFQSMMIRALLLTSLFLCQLGWAAGQEFRIESQVYSADETEPVSRSVTLFTSKLVCDFLMDDQADPKPVEIVIFDIRQGQLALLDPQREVQVTVPDVQLIKLTEGLRRETMQNEKTKFLVEETYEENQNWSDGWVTLDSPSISYRVKGAQPDDVSVLLNYYRFLDQFTRLNSTDPTQLPPFPRMRLNRTLKQLGWIPSEVQISVKQNQLFREPFQATAKHVFVEGLTPSDQELLAGAKKKWLHYEQVDLTKYRGLEAPKPAFLSSRGTEKKR